MKISSPLERDEFPHSQDSSEQSGEKDIQFGGGGGGYFRT